MQITVLRSREHYVVAASEGMWVGITHCQTQRECRDVLKEKYPGVEADWRITSYEGEE